MGKGQFEVYLGVGGLGCEGDWVVISGATKSWESRVGLRGNCLAVDTARARSFFQKHMLF